MSSGLMLVLEADKNIYHPGTGLLPEVVCLIMFLLSLFIGTN